MILTLLARGPLLPSVEVVIVFLVDDIYIEGPHFQRLDAYSLRLQCQETCMSRVILVVRASCLWSEGGCVWEHSGMLYIDLIYLIFVLYPSGPSPQSIPLCCLLSLASEFLGGEWHL